jgi:hypothetical protein
MSPLSSSAVKPLDVFGVGEQYVTPSKTLGGNFTDPYNQILDLVAPMECSPIQVSSLKVNKLLLELLKQIKQKPCCTFFVG